MRSAILICNLGSPASLELSDIRTYLKQFLMDPYVIDVGFFLRYALVNWSIIPKRINNTREAYSSIWTEAGSPLITITQQFGELLRGKVSVPIGVAMRYGQPSIESEVNALVQANPDLENLYVIAMYPHYAESSTRTAEEQITKAVNRINPSISVTFNKPFYEDDNYISALCEVAKPYLDQPYDHLVLSYHGLPVRHLVKADPTQAHCQKVENCCETPSPAHATCYRHHTVQTTRRFIEATGVKADRYSQVFQSRLGKDPWLEPFLNGKLTALARSGVKSVLVIAPSFVTDCLETLEEINMAGRELFLEAGGETFTYVPCLNTHPLWVDTVAGWCNNWLTEVNG